MDNDRWLSVAALQSAIEALAVQRFVMMRQPRFFSALTAGMIAARLGFQAVLASSARGVLKDQARAVNSVVAVVMAMLATKANPTAAPSPFQLGLIGWVSAVLTDQPGLYFYFCGFLASMAQGVSHAIAGEAATLVQLQAAGGLAKFAHEWSHTTFFPNLLCVLTRTVPSRRTFPAHHMSSALCVACARAGLPAAVDLRATCAPA